MRRVGAGSWYDDREVVANIGTIDVSHDHLERPPDRRGLVVRRSPTANLFARLRAELHQHDALRTDDDR